MSGPRPQPCRRLPATTLSSCAPKAALAHPCGAAPLPASSGRPDRDRLNRGGSRSANAALYRIVVVRMHDRHTRQYVARRTAQGLQKKDIISCLKAT
ncbi:transposase [Streptomyces noursei]|uniref:transposase n=1 Tax=Streptomyces noursei TaxID=1971 RepID=UPI000C9A671E